MGYVMTKTDAGLALDQKMPNSGNVLKLVRAKTGSGRVPVSELSTLLDVEEPEQELELKDLIRPETGTNLTIPVTLTNRGLDTGYAFYQVGVYAEDPDLGEILYLVAQKDDAESVPSEADSPGFAIDWNLATNVSNAETVQVLVDEVGRLTVGQADRRYVRADNILDEETIQVAKETGFLSE